MRTTIIAVTLLLATAAYADTTADALAGYQAEMQKAQQQAQKLQQDMVNTQAVILRLEGAIAALTALETEEEDAAAPSDTLTDPAE